MQSRAGETRTSYRKAPRRQCLGHFSSTGTQGSVNIGSGVRNGGYLIPYPAARFVVPELELEDLGCHRLGFLLRVAWGHGGKHDDPRANRRHHLLIHRDGCREHPLQNGYFFCVSMTGDTIMDRHAEEHWNSVQRQIPTFHRGTGSGQPGLGSGGGERLGREKLQRGYEMSDFESEQHRAIQHKTLK